MNIAITGSGGFIGKALCSSLNQEGHTIVKISRSDLAAGSLGLAEKLRGVTAVINLAGAAIITRWTARRRKEIYRSRIDSTRHLVHAIRSLDQKPAVLINASAIGIYDSKHTHDEESRHLAGDFLGRVVRDWEYAANLAGETGLRVVIFRLGIVLGSQGGVVHKLKPLFRWGLGARIGNGRQTMSFIHVDDVASAVKRALTDENMKGPYNLVAPEVVNNKRFTSSLAKSLKRKAWLIVPEFALRLLYGNGSRVLTTGQHVLPVRLSEIGFDFQYPTLEKCLEGGKAGESAFS